MVKNSGAVFALLFLAALTFAAQATRQDILSLQADGGNPKILKFNGRQLLQVSTGTLEPVEGPSDLGTAGPLSENELLVGEPITEDSITGNIEEADALDGSSLDTESKIVAEGPNTEGLTTPSSEDSFGATDTDFDLEFTIPEGESDNEELAPLDPDIDIIPAEESPLVNLDESVSDVPDDSTADEVDLLEEDGSLLGTSGGIFAPLTEDDNETDVDNQLLGMSTLDETSEPIDEEDAATSVIDSGGATASEAPMAEKTDDLDSFDLDDIDITGPAPETSDKNISTNPEVEESAEDGDFLDTDLDTETSIIPQSEEKTDGGDDDLEEAMATQTSDDIMIAPEADKDSEPLDMDMEIALDADVPLDEDMDSESGADLEEESTDAPAEEATEKQPPGPVAEEDDEPLDLDLDDLPSVVTPREETIDVASGDDLEEDEPAEVAFDGMSPIPDAEEDLGPLDINLDSLLDNTAPIEESIDPEIDGDMDEVMLPPASETAAEAPGTEDVDTIEIDEAEPSQEAAPPIPEMMDSDLATPDDEALPDSLVDPDIDEGSELGSPQVEAQAVAGASNALNATISFDVDYSTVSGDADRRKELEGAVVSALAKATGVEEEDVEVVDIRQGSIIVETKIQLPEDRDPLDVGENLIANADTLFETDFVGVYGVPEIITEVLSSAPVPETDGDESDDMLASPLSPLVENTPASDVIVEEPITEPDLVDSLAPTSEINPSTEGPFDEPSMETGFDNMLSPVSERIPTTESPADEAFMEADIGDLLSPAGESIPATESPVDEAFMEADIGDLRSPEGESSPTIESHFDEFTIEEELVEPPSPTSEASPTAEGIVDESDTEFDLVESLPPVVESIPSAEGPLDEVIEVELAETLPPVFEAVPFDEQAPEDSSFEDDFDAISKIETPADESGLFGPSEEFPMDETKIGIPAQEPLPEVLAEIDQDDMDETVIDSAGAILQPESEQVTPVDDDDVFILTSPDEEPEGELPPIDAETDASPDDIFLDIDATIPMGEPASEPRADSDGLIDRAIPEPFLEAMVPSPDVEFALPLDSAPVLDERTDVPVAETSTDLVLPDSEPIPAVSTMVVSLTFDLDYDEITGDSEARQQLETGIISSLAAAAGVDEENVEIVDILQGSVIVKTEIVLPEGQDPEESAALTEELQTNGPQFDPSFTETFGRPEIEAEVSTSPSPSTADESVPPGTAINAVVIPDATPVPSQEDEPTDSEASTATESTATSTTASTAKVVNEFDIIESRSSARQQMLSLTLSVVLPIFIVLVGVRDPLVL